MSTKPKRKLSREEQLVLAEKGLYAFIVLGLIGNIVLFYFIYKSFSAKPHTNQLRLVAWNVESGGNDPNLIAEQIKYFSDYDVIGLNEVNSKNVEKYVKALGPQFQSFTSKTGGADRLAILFDKTRFELLEQKEMGKYRDWEFSKNTFQRSPIYLRLKDRESGFEFVFMTNHLIRGKSEVRQEQARGLREWARDSQMPIIAIGDFNFDYSFNNQEGNKAFNLFMKDGVWKWIRPKEEIDSNWSDRNKDGVDDYPDSMLDFAFVANGAKDLKCECEIVVREGDFPSDETKSDHRPTVLVVEL